MIKAFISYALILAAFVLFYSGTACAAERLEVYGETYLPFLVEQKGSLTGPYAEAFAVLARQQGIEVHYVAMPTKRLLQLLERQPNTCGLAVNFSPGSAETLIFLGRVAPIMISVFAKQGKIGRLNNIEDLRRYRIGAIDIAEVRDALDIAGITYEPLSQASRGVSMLIANRFDLLLSDTLPELTDTPAVTRVFNLARFERWVACNNQIMPVTATKLRKVLSEGVFAESVRQIWARYGLQTYYDEVRREWDAIGPNKRKK
ncbi:hypothetical protein ACUHMQ_07150 [Chitinimonas sp. PSY-7]|uniref:hypothetical protein n=1 Tax=Chitinimonas sp. PSY-7 TaxID=3459088 RepID=UPI00403FF34D